MNQTERPDNGELSQFVHSASLTREIISLATHLQHTQHLPSLQKQAKGEIHKMRASFTCGMLYRDGRDNSQH